MGVPDASVGCLLENITQILTFSYHRQPKMRECFEALKTQLSSLQSLLVESYYCDDNSKFMEMRKTLDEAEDAVHPYLLMVTLASDGWMRKRYLDYYEYPVVIGNISRDIGSIAAKVKQFNHDSILMPGQTHQIVAELDRRYEALQVDEEYVIGFEVAAEEVQRLLLRGTEHLEIVSIVGRLGLGKTTLAKKVYKDLDVSYEYEVKAFIRVSQEYDKKEVLLQILASFSKSNEEVKSMNEEQLEKDVYKMLEGKQYLVVLDDVWKEKDWNGLKGAFPNNKNRCRVLITTRSAEVAKHANQNPESLYRLEFLPLDESRKLLRWRVFHQVDIVEVHRELERCEIEIATICDGLPLAIVVIAGILVNQPHRVEWWNDVANSMNGYIARDVKQTTRVIELMYKHLPSYLKLCFLYLGVFPRNSEIQVWKLVRLWVSEGFIPQESEMNLEKLAEHYLKDLVHRNLVTVGKIRTCWVHDAISDFCKKEAAKGNLFQEITEENLNSLLRESATLDQCRRLCNTGTNISQHISRRGKYVRSFLRFGREGAYVDQQFPTILLSLKLVKVLEIQSLIFTRFPRVICSRLFLKYICMSSIFSVIPQEMSDLWHLQTLIVTTTSPTLDIKAGLQKMSQFRHLHTNASTTLSKPSNKYRTPIHLSVSTVQTLCTISTESCTLEVFNWAPKLKKLGIRGTLAKLFEVDNDGCSFLPHFSKLVALENLKLLNDDDTNSPLSSLPVQFPGRLTKLTLMNTRLEWKEMSKLGELESLKVLKLKEHSFQGRLWSPVKGGFRRLIHLFVGETDLVVWEASADHFPELKSLELNRCDKLDSFPQGLADIPGLKMVVLHCTNPVVVSSARKLQMLKLEEARKGNNNSFELSVYPSGH